MVGLEDAGSRSGGADAKRLDGEACLREAYQAIFHGDFETALLWFGRAISLEPDDASLHYKASITCVRSGKMDRAEAYAEKAAELDPENPVYMLNRNAVRAKRLARDARPLLEAEPPEIETAMPLLAEAELLDPLCAEAKLLLGLACRLQGDRRNAIRHLREMLGLDPEHEEAARLLRTLRAERRAAQQSKHGHPPYSKSKRNR